MRVLTVLLLSLFFIPISSWTKPVELVPWDSPEGIQRLERSHHKIDFFALVNQFESQDNKLYCGLASTVIILNALRLYDATTQKPQDASRLTSQDRQYLPEGFDPIFNRYTQNTVLNDQVKTKEQVLGKPMLVNDKQVKDFGLQLRQLHELLLSHHLQSVLRVADDQLEVESIRQELSQNLATPNDYVLVNYKRAELGQNGGGHISPLGAYDSTTDSFLVLDVNPNAAKWVWVKTEDLVTAMRTFDTIENRGYVLVSGSR